MSSQTSSSDVLLSIVIPTYNEAECLPIICDQFEAKIGNSFKYEIVFVNDGSPHQAVTDQLNRLRSRENVRIIHLSRNFGQHSAMAAGLINAVGEFILIMDADLQYRPEDVLKLFEVARIEGKSLVISTIESRKHSLPKRALTWFYYQIFTALGTPVARTDLGSTFLVSQHLAQGLAKMADRHRFTITMALWLTNDVAYVKVDHHSRQHGQSGYTFAKTLAHSLTGFTAFSSRPLYFAAVLGFLFACASVSGVLYIMARIWVYHLRGLPGWSSLIVVILFCTSIILISLGVMGIYIGRIFEMSQRRPLYFLAQHQSENFKLFENESNRG